MGFNDDEASIGYNAYSILSSGKDEWGRLLPFPVSEGFGDWKLVNYLYLTAFSQFFLGPNEFSTRLPSAIFGVLAVYATYLLAKKLFERRVGLISAFLLSISPWHIAESRNAFDSDILIFFIPLAVYFFLRGLKEQKYQAVSFICFIIAFYIYRTAWIFIPILGSVLTWAMWQNLRKSRPIFFRNLVICLILLVPLIPTVLTFKGQSRIIQESFVTGVQNQGIVDEVNERRGYCREKITNDMCKIAYNKYSFYLSTYFNNYFSNLLSPETYYIRGSPTGYQSFPSRGFFYTFELPLVILGLTLLLKNRNSEAKIVIVSWLLIVPIGASVTGVGNPGRLNILMPIPQIIAAYALLSIFHLIKSKKLAIVPLVLITLVILSSTSRLIFDIFFEHPQVSARYQRYGYKELFQYLESQKSNYNQIIVSRKNDDAKQYIHYLFFNKTDPDFFRNNVIRQRDKNGWVQVEQIDKIHFYPTTPELELLPDNSLVAVGEHEIQLQVMPIYTINDPKGDRLFEIYNGDQLKNAKREYELELMRLKLINRNPNE